jgi:hypothetical protein
MASFANRLRHLEAGRDFACMAFVADSYGRRILGWTFALAMATSILLDGTQQTIWTRRGAAHVDPVHRTPRRSRHSRTGRRGWVFLRRRGRRDDQRPLPTELIKTESK